jgi:hypothetical protein
MKTEEQIIAFLRKKVAQWQPDPIAYVRRAGANRLAAEFLSDPDLSQFCGWLARPADDQLLGVVQQFIQEENPALGYVVSSIVKALIDACTRRHELNKAAAYDNIKAGAGVVGVATLLVGLVVLLATKENE